MAVTYAFELRNYTDRKGLRPIVMRITAGKAVSRKSTGFKVVEKHWDFARERVKRTHPNYSIINNALDALKDAAEAAHASAVAEGEVIAHPSQIQNRASSSMSFYDLMAERIKTFERGERWSTAKRYETILKKLQDYAPKLDATSITAQWVLRYKAHLQAKGNSANTIISNMAAIKATYSYGARLGYYPEKTGLFTSDTVGSKEPTHKETLTAKEIGKLEDVQLSGTTALARDMFLFSYYAAGMRFGDVVRLGWESVGKEAIVYAPGKVKGKTGVKITVPIHGRLRQILNRYRGKGRTVFALLESGASGKELVAQVEARNAMVNKYLQVAVNKAGIGKLISFHCARHSFARLANEVSGRDVYGIKGALGHSSIQVTEIYLGQDAGAVDALLKKVYGE